METYFPFFFPLSGKLRIFVGWYENRHKAFVNTPRLILAPKNAIYSVLINRLGLLIS